MLLLPITSRVILPVGLAWSGKTNKTLPWASAPIGTLVTNQKASFTRGMHAEWLKDKLPFDGFRPKLSEIYKFDLTPCVRDTNKIQARIKRRAATVLALDNVYTIKELVDVFCWHLLTRPHLN
ncbi:hypothetical protein AVEN_62046-1 [Araneus ventricosus]|uniref:Uncharacterized protein n=1 Tax=Araneus ventricosus TaxID=182803 RepID=A0A4Y2JDY4_ARAVE|nr:hypothetical protein AVEN_62046-1 [Araneus ventricosus]